MARHDPKLIEAFTANRAAIVSANADSIADLRSQCEAEKRGVTAAFANGEYRDALPNDWEAFTAELRRVERHYDALIAPLLPKAPVHEGRFESRDPAYQPGNASLRYWGRV